MTWLAVAVGGALGAVGRHALNGFVLQHWPWRPFPAGVFLVNVLGCFLIGLIVGASAAGRLPLGELSKTFLTVGLLGGFTTFSSFGLDTHTLVRHGDVAGAVLNAGGQVVLGLSAVWVGVALAGGR